MPCNIPAQTIAAVHRRYPLLTSRVARNVLAQLDRAAPLERPGVAVGLFLAAAVAAVAAVLLRAHRWTRRCLIGGTVLLTVLGAAAAVNSYVGYVPTLSSLGGTVTSTNGRIVGVDVPAPGLRVRATRTYVYLPPGYDTPQEAHRRYPVLYLLHGFPGSAIDWFRAGEATIVEESLLKERAIRPVILVAPTINNGSLRDFECIDAIGGPQLETFLSRDVPRYVTSHYRALRGRIGTGIGGFSSGADCALDLGLRHNGEYSVILANTTTGEPGLGALKNALRGDRRLYATHAPYLYLPKLRIRHPVSVFLDAGSVNPHEAARVRLLAKDLERKGEEVAVRLYPAGSHTWREAREGFPYELAFAARVFSTASAPQASVRGASCAVAHKEPPTAPPVLSLVLLRDTTTPGSRIVLAGRVTRKGGGPIEKLVVALDERTATGWRRVALRRTDEDGGVLFTERPDVTTVYRLRAGSQHSGVITVTVG